MTSTAKATALFMISLALLGCNSGSRNNPNSFAPGVNPNGGVTGTTGNFGSTVDLTVLAYMGFIDPATMMQNTSPQVGAIDLAPMIMVENIGFQAAGPHGLGLYSGIGVLTPSTQNFPFDRMVIANLPSNPPPNASMPITLVSPANELGIRSMTPGFITGPTSISAIIDDLSLLREINEGNNAIKDMTTFMFRANTGVDLTPNSFINFSSSTLTYGTNFTVSCNVINVGNQSTSNAFNVSAFFADPAGNLGLPVIGNVVSIPGLNSLNTVAVNLPCNQVRTMGVTPMGAPVTLQTGRAQFFVVIDSNMQAGTPGQIIETDETNNVQSEFITFQ